MKRNFAPATNIRHTTSNRFRVGILALLITCLHATSGTAGEPPQVDTQRLAQLMKKEGFVPPTHFKALVMELTFNKSRKSIVREQHYSYHKTAGHTGGWNAASSVKVIPAIAAIQYIRKLGFNPNARLTFHGETDVRYRLIDLVQDALTPSNNIAYNRLIQFVGFDRLHGEFLTDKNDFTGTSLARAYGGPAWKKLGGTTSLRTSPPITIEQGGKKYRLPKRVGKVKTACAGTCTSLTDLSIAMRKLMLQEQLRPRDTFRLKKSDLIMIRRALRADRKRGEEVVNIFRNIFRDDNMKFYHKAGFFGGWYSDIIYIYKPGQKAWIVSMAGNPGRNSLDNAARIIGNLLKSGEL